MGQIDDDRIAEAKDLRVRTVAHATKEAHAGHGGYSPSPERWESYVQDERRNQREGKYPPEHDREHGVDHLLIWAKDYSRRGLAVESSALIESAREQLLALVVDLNRARENGTVFTYGEIQRRLMGVYTQPMGSDHE